jgi:hypothetical protein
MGCHHDTEGARRSNRSVLLPLGSPTVVQLFAHSFCKEQWSCILLRQPLSRIIGKHTGGPDGDACRGQQGQTASEPR